VLRSLDRPARDDGGGGLHRPKTGAGDLPENTIDRSRTETLLDREYVDAWLQHAQEGRPARLLAWGAQGHRYRAPRRWVHVAALYVGGACLRAQYIAWTLKIRVY